jgi:hypothetical protein
MLSVQTAAEHPMEERQVREVFDTGLSKIRQEIKSRLVPHGLYGSVNQVDTESADRSPSGSTIELIVKDRHVERSFDRAQIEDCHLRVRGDVLLGIISMIDEVSAKKVTTESGT